MAESIRERIVRLIKEMRNRTMDRGATPAEAAGFASKVAEWIEKYQIEEAELSAGQPERPIEICQEYIRTGKRVFNPGVTALINGLATGSSCRIVLHGGENCSYGLIGDALDCEYVRQMAATLTTLLKSMANDEGREHGYEKAGLVRWSNQYLMAAGDEIRKRLIADRDARSKVREIEHAETTPTPTTGPTQALAVVTGNTLAARKAEAVLAKMKELYPRLGKGKASRSEYNGTARDRGRAAGQSVGLNRSVN